MESERPPNTLWSTTTKSYLGIFLIMIGMVEISSPRLILSLFSGGFFAALPHLLAISTLTVPVALMEIYLGQYSMKNSITFWDFCPVLRGIGITSYAITGVLIVIYHLNCTYCLHFMLTAFNYKVPWIDCDLDWARENCYTLEDNASIHHFCNQEKGQDYCDSLDWQFSAEQYFIYKVLQHDDNVTTLTPPVPMLAVEHFVVSFFIYLATFKAVYSLEFFLWFYTFYPILALLAMFFVSLIGPGGIDGLIYTLSPQWDVLEFMSTWPVWIAFTIYGSNIGLGLYVTLGSRNPFRTSNNFCIMSGVVMAGVVGWIMIAMGANFIGIMAHNFSHNFDTELEVDDYFFFVKVTMAITFIDGPTQLWVFIFFSLILIGSLRTILILVHLQLVVLYDSSRQLANNTMYVALGYCLLQYGVGLTGLGKYGFDLFNNLETIITTVVLPVLTILELCAVSYIYGLTRFSSDVHFMLGKPLCKFWIICLGITPIIQIICLGLNLYNHWGILRKFSFYTSIFMGSIFLVIIIGILVHLLMKDSSQGLFEPSRKWVLREPTMKKSRQMFTAHSMTKEYIYRQNLMNRKYRDEDVEFD